jgi:hypothetical protein
MTYMNDFDDMDCFTPRDLLLGAMFALAEHQYGVGYVLAHSGREKFGDSLFDHILRYTKYRSEFEASIAVVMSIPSRLSRRARTAVERARHA